LSEDGDPIDVLVCNTRQLVPACVINVRPIGVLIMEDNAGQDVIRNTCYFLQHGMFADSTMRVNND
jgi:hypothetical protein